MNIVDCRTDPFTLSGEKGVGIHLFIHGLMVGLCACLVGRLQPLREVRRTLATIEELKTALKKQANAKEDQNDSERFNGAGKADKSGCLPVKVLCQPLLCLCNIKKAQHPLLQAGRLLCSILSKSNIERGAS
jgi:hypothetical protein